MKKISIINAPAVCAQATHCKDIIDFILGDQYA